MSIIDTERKFKDWVYYNIPLGVKARLICRGSVKNDRLYRLCIWALKKYCRVEVVG